MIDLNYQGCKPDTDTEKGSSWNVKIPKEGGSKMVSLEVENEKWRRLLLHWMYDAFDVSTDDREEDFFPRNGM
ncbi:hypothetical protein Tco_1096500 [Tanacetum coccineum]